MLSSSLKEFTKDAHISLEKRIISDIKSINSTDTYFRLLRLFYGYYLPVETRVGAFCGETLNDYEERRKADLLLQDLRNLSLDLQESIPLAKNIPVIENVPQAFGALYVLEGSTLGGVYISKMLEERLVDIRNSLSFFRGYEGETIEKWSSFKQTLDFYSFTKEEKEMVLNTAKDTFVKFENWIIEND